MQRAIKPLQLPTAEGNKTITIYKLLKPIKPLQLTNAEGNKTITIYQCKRQQSHYNLPMQKAIKPLQFQAVKLGSKLTATLSSFPVSHLSLELNGDVDVSNKE